MEEPDGFPPLPGPSSQILKRRIDHEEAADIGRKIIIADGATGQSSTMAEVQKLRKENEDLLKRISTMEEIIGKLKRTRSKERSEKEEKRRSKINEKILSAEGANESHNSFALLATLEDTNATNKDIPEPMDEGAASNYQKAGEFINY